MRSGLSSALKSVDEAREETVGQLVGGSGDITISHTDQGSIYTSMEYDEIIREHNVVRNGTGTSCRPIERQDSGQAVRRNKF